MTVDFSKIFTKVVKCGPYAKAIEDNRKEVYTLSRELSDEQGYLLMNLFDDTVKQTRKLTDKQHEFRNDNHGTSKVKA